MSKKRLIWHKKSGFVWHKSRALYVKKVRESPFILQKGRAFSRRTTPHLMAYFICLGHFANVGGGGCRNRSRYMLSQDHFLSPNLQVFQILSSTLGLSKWEANLAFLVTCDGMSWKLSRKHLVQHHRRTGYKHN